MHIDNRIIDDYNDRCANCEEVNESDNMFTAELQTGSELGWGAGFTKYKVSGDTVRMKICLQCIRKKRLKQWMYFLVFASVAAILILIDLLPDDKISVLGAFGIFELGVLLIALPTMTYSDLAFCDEVAKKHFRKNAPEELRKDKKFRVFTRAEIKKMMKL